MSFAANLRRLRKARGLTQEQLALAAGFPGQSRISNYESEGASRREPSEADARAIARVLGVPLGALFDPIIGEVEAHEGRGDSATATGTTQGVAEGGLGILDLIPSATPRSKARLTTYREKLERGDALTDHERRDLASIIKRLEALNASIT